MELELLEKCLESGKELKQALLMQQKVILRFVNMLTKKDSEDFQCPMCEEIFSTKYQDFENHVVNHFEIDSLSF